MSLELLCDGLSLARGLRALLAWRCFELVRVLVRMLCVGGPRCLRIRMLALRGRTAGVAPAVAWLTLSVLALAIFAAATTTTATTASAARATTSAAALTTTAGGLRLSWTLPLRVTCVLTRTLTVTLARTWTWTLTLSRALRFGLLWAARLALLLSVAALRPWAASAVTIATVTTVTTVAAITAITPIATVSAGAISIPVSIAAVAVTAPIAAEVSTAPAITISMPVSVAFAVLGGPRRSRGCGGRR